MYIYLLNGVIKYFTVILEYYIYNNATVAWKLIGQVYMYTHPSYAADLKLNFYVVTYDYIWTWVMRELSSKFPSVAMIMISLKISFYVFSYIAPSIMIPYINIYILLQ